MKKLIVLCLTVLAVIIAVMASAEEAQSIALDITAMAKIQLSKHSEKLPNLLDGDYETEWKVSEAEYVTFTLPEDQPCYTLYVLMRGEPETLYIEVPDGKKWRRLPQPAQQFNTQCFELGGLIHFRLRSSWLLLQESLILSLFLPRCLPQM